MRWAADFSEVGACDWSPRLQLAADGEHYQHLQRHAAGGRPLRIIIDLLLLLEQQYLWGEAYLIPAEHARNLHRPIEGFDPSPRPHERCGG